MTTSPTQPSHFVVGLDCERVRSSRAGSRLIMQIGLPVCALSLVGLVVGNGLLMRIGAEVSDVSFLLSIATGMCLCFMLVHGARRAYRSRNWYAARHLPPFVLRMSHAALEVGIEDTTSPVQLPWELVLGLEVRRTTSYPMLALRLTSVPFGIAGVSGLDQTAVRAALSHDPTRTSLPLGAIHHLQQPLETIHFVMRDYTSGRCGVVRW